MVFRNSFFVFGGFDGNSRVNDFYEFSFDLNVSNGDSQGGMSEHDGAAPIGLTICSGLMTSPLAPRVGMPPAPGPLL